MKTRPQKPPSAEERVMEQILHLLDPIVSQVGITKTQARKEMAGKSLSFLQNALADLKAEIAREKQAAPSAKRVFGSRLLSLLRSGSALKPLELPHA
jgi:hypothetical protein